MVKTISAEEFDRIFDEGQEDILQYCDMSSFRRPGLEQQKVSMSLPNWIVNSLDQEAARIGSDRQKVIEMWLSERINKQSA